MGVFIYGIDKPKCCAECDFNHETYLLSRHICIANHGKEIHVNLDTGFPDDCPMLEVKAPHGRLVDASEDATWDSRYDHFDDRHMKAAQNMLDDLPTVIEAEGET